MENQRVKKYFADTIEKIKKDDELSLGDKAYFETVLIGLHNKVSKQEASQMNEEVKLLNEVVLTYKEKGGLCTIPLGLVDEIYNFLANNQLLMSKKDEES